MQRGKHLRWAKGRAIAHLERGNGNEAMVSLLADLRQHPALRTHPHLETAPMLYRDLAEVRAWIESFN